MPQMAKISTWFTLALVSVLLTAPAFAQERGEEVVGSITSVDGGTLTVSRENRDPVTEGGDVLVLRDEVVDESVDGVSHERVRLVSQ